MKAELLTIANLDEAAKSFAMGFADDVLRGASPEYRRKFEEALFITFQKGALWALKSVEEERKK